MESKNKIEIFPLIVMVLVLILTNSCKKDEEPPVIKDSDGNVYTSVTIGTQVWMVENLKTTKLNDGSTITYITDDNEWDKLITPGFGWWDNDKANYKDPYGAYYNWETVKSGKLCPSGWHVPSDTEWAKLISYLGGENVAGGKLKETGTAHWESPNTGATNETGFTLVGGGFRNWYGSYTDFGTSSVLWSSTEYDAEQAWAVWCSNWSTEAGRAYIHKTAGYNVRCLKN